MADIIRHKRGATLRIQRAFPDDPDGWAFTGALRLPDGTEVPLICDAMLQSDYVGDLSVPAAPGVLFLSLDAADTEDWPLGLIPGEFTATIDDQVAKSATFFIHVLPEV